MTDRNGRRPGKRRQQRGQTGGSASTITLDRIKHSACVRPFRKLYIEVAHNEGAGQLSPHRGIADQVAVVLHAPSKAPLEAWCADREVVPVATVGNFP